MSAINWGKRVELGGNSLYMPVTVRLRNSFGLSLTKRMAPMGEVFPKYFDAISSEMATSEFVFAEVPAISFMPRILYIEVSANRHVITLTESEKIFYFRKVFFHLLCYRKRRHIVLT